MLFDTKQFELHFEEKHLKKGLKFFEQGAVDLIEKSGHGEFRLRCGQTELSLRKKGDKLLAFECACKKHLYCEHLAAALFYLLRDTLGLAPNRKQKTKRFKRKALSVNISTRAVYDFLNNTAKAKPKEKNLLQLFYSIPEADCFDFYSQLFHSLLEPYYEKPVLNQARIDEACAALEKLSSKILLLKTTESVSFYVHLALLDELQNFLQLRFTGHETELIQLRKSCYSFLDDAFKQGLSDPEKAAWQNAAFGSLRNNHVLKSGTFAFLIPRLLSWLHNRSTFEELNDLLSRRKYKVPYYANLNYLTLAKIQVCQCEYKLYKQRACVKDETSAVEDVLAEIELAFCNNKVTKGFKLIEAGYQVILSTHKHYFEEYTAYAVAKAKEYQRQEIALRFLEERLTKGLSMRPDDFDDYLRLLHELNQPQKIDQLIDAIRYNPRYYSFDKLSIILQKINRSEELITEIKKQDNAFRLLHGILIQKLPAFEVTHLPIYLTQFINAMAALKVYSHQQSLFETAKEFIEQLPRETQLTLLDKIITHSGSESQLSRYIRGIYNL